MRTLTPEGRHRIEALAARHGLSVETALGLLRAVAAGHGAMAQFDLAELGGAGQWMRGGMTMVGDMFDHDLKAKVDAVCTEVAELLTAEPGGTRADRGQEVSLFLQEDDASGWWPKALGMPASSGAQNTVRYAYFPGPRRLAVAVGGEVAVYDTADHAIGGFAQQQGPGASLSFTSQHGTIALARLRRVDAGSLQTAEASTTQAKTAASGGEDLLALLERLADLHAKGVLDADEFAAKKAEILKRI